MDAKYLKYYAVVYADADGMGKFLQELSRKDTCEADTKLFSERCLSYDVKAAEMINDYGGMAIYAGGDDLLFLAPLKSRGKTIFGLCKDISKLFQEEISGEDKDFSDCTVPTVSFGISAQYYKYPLYEAFKRARECLFGMAKAHKFCGSGGELVKNCIYFHLEKHSGQSADILIGNEALEEYLELLEMMFQIKDERMVKSLGAKLYECKNIIGLMDRQYRDGSAENRRTPSWDNLFDNEGQVSGKAFRRKVEEWYYGNLADGEKRIVTVKSGGQEEGETFDSLLAVLRIDKF